MVQDAAHGLGERFVYRGYERLLLGTRGCDNMRADDLLD
jgi:hypothetical protein